MGDAEENPSKTVAEFVANQNKINESNSRMLEISRNERKEMKDMLLKIMESFDKEPLRKKRKLPEGDEGENSAPQNHQTQEHQDAIALSIQPEEVIHDVENDEVEDEESRLWNNANNTTDTLGNGLDAGMGLSSDIDDSLEGSNLASKYQDLLDQTEEVLGDPIDQDLANVIQQTWGKSLLSADRKKELWKGINIPSNCKTLQAPRLNTKVFIRVNENARTKDKGAMERQKGLSRAAIPVLYSLGNLNKSKDSVGKIHKIANMEPKSLAEAKRFIDAMKRHAKETNDQLSEMRTTLQKSVRVMSYDFTTATKKRKTDVCGALGPTFNAYAQDTKTSEEYLFDEEALKTMKTELNQVKAKGKEFESKSSNSKNANYPEKSPRGGQNQGQSNKKTSHNSNSNSYNNFNKNSSKSNKYGKGKKGP